MNDEVPTMRLTALRLRWWLQIPGRFTYLLGLTWIRIYEAIAIAARFEFNSAEHIVCTSKALAEATFPVTPSAGGAVELVKNTSSRSNVPRNKLLITLSLYAT